MDFTPLYIMASHTCKHMYKQKKKKISGQWQSLENPSQLDAYLNKYL